MKLPHSSHKEFSTPHIASPDVHIDNDNQLIVMYFHGLESYGRQLSRVATSKNGIDFGAYPETIGPTYLRAFTYKNELFAMTMPGQFFRSSDGFKKFEPGPRLFNPNMRHSALLVQDGTLHVFWTQVKDAPERILVSTVDIKQPFEDWCETDSYELLRPEREWEGAMEPVKPSIRSVAYGLVCQLRDPAILVDDEQIYLFYAAGGRELHRRCRIEFGIGQVDGSTQPKVKHEDVVFAEAQDQKLLARCYRSEYSIGHGIVMVHGGAWTANDRTTPWFVSESLARKGLTVLSLDFRCGPNFTHPAASADVVAGIRFLRFHAKEFGVHAESVGLIGSSSGGHLVLFAGMNSQREDHQTTQICVDEERFEEVRDITASPAYIVALWPCF